jgi:tetratricopeptide (TPR) repeat protein
MRWVFLIGMGACAAEHGYVDPQLCRTCHTGIYDSYMQSGMARTFGPAGEVPALSRFAHRPSQRSYSVEKRRDGAYLRRLDTAGGNLLEKRMDFAVGSGAHSRTYVHRTPDDRLIELPVSWYAENGGSWAMSPGYDRPEHSDFRREISEACLFCHNGYPSQANQGLAQGIDCQRCHGSGEEHARRGGAITNPARLPAERKMEVCLQCHLESASRTLPAAVRRFGRTVFSYRPGEPLSDYQVYFDFIRREGDQRLTVNGAGYTLMQSRCFLRSGGRLTCVTCHDPHRPLAAAATYTQACRNCHAAAHTPSTAGCTGCHMPKRRTEDAVHVVLTDHLIRRKPLREAPENLAERHDRQSGPVTLLYPGQLTGTQTDRLYQAIAQVQNSADLPADTEKLAAAIRDVRPTVPDPYAVLGDGWRKAGRAEQALQAYRQAFGLGSREPEVLVAAGEILMQLRRTDEAIALLEPAVQDAPRLPSLRNTLAVLYGRKQRFADAIRILEDAARIDADDPVTWLNLGVCHQALGQKNRAAADYREAIRLQPDFARARQYLQVLLKDQL